MQQATASVVRDHGENSDASSGRHVAILSSSFWPEPIASGATATEFGVFLRHAGLRVKVATAMPFYPQWEIWPGYRRRLWIRENYAGIEIVRTWHLVRPRVSTASRVLQELTMCVCSVPGLLSVLRGAGAAFIFTPSLGFAFAGAVLARLMRVPYVAVVKDVLPDAAIELGMLSSPFMIAMSEWMARKLYAWSEEIHTLGEGMRRRIARLAGTAARIQLVPDTVDGQELYPVEREHNQFRKRFVPDGVLAVLHTGNMGRKQGLDLILRTAAIVQDDPTIRFYVFGDGAVREEFLRQRDAQGLGNVSHFPLQERQMLKHMLSGADIVLVSQRREVIDIVVPSKLLTAMAAGAMIVGACSKGSEMEQILSESGGGIVIPAEDEQALATVIRQQRTGQIDSTGYRRRARAFALRHFDRQAVYGPVAAALQRRLGGDGNDAPRNS